MTYHVVNPGERSIYSRLFSCSLKCFPIALCTQFPGLSAATLDGFSSVWLPPPSGGLPGVSVTSPSDFPFPGLCSFCSHPKAVCTLNYTCLPQMASLLSLPLIFLGICANIFSSGGFYLSGIPLWLGGVSSASVTIQKCAGWGQGVWAVFGHGANG